MKERNSLLLISILAIATLLISLVLGIVFGKKAALLGIWAVPAMVGSFVHPRLGLLALIIYLPLSNTFALSVVRVFQVVGNFIGIEPSYALYKIAKDAFYFPALAAILIKTKTFKQLRPQIKPFLITTLILLASSLITFLFVNLPRGGIAVGIVGLKTLLSYIPLVLCGYYLIEQKRDLFVVNRLLIVMILVCCVLALIQYFLLVQGICPDNEFLNQLEVLVPKSDSQFYPDITEKATLKAQCFVGGSVLYNPDRGLIRLPGTFSDPWQWSWFLVSSSVISYAASFSDPQKRWRVAGWVAMVLVFLATLVSGQRIPFLLVPLFYLVLFIATSKHKQKLPLKLGILGLISLLAVTLNPFIQERGLNFLDRWLYSSPIDFVGNQMQWMFNYAQLFGFGLGKATSGALHVAGEEGIRLIETYYAKLLYEIGIVGFIAFMALVTILCILTFKAYLKVKNAALKHWGLCIWIFLLFISYNPYYYPLSVEPVSVYYWLFAGILLKLPEIRDKLEDEARFPEKSEVEN
ncbi:MAG: hypothetical protein EWV49_02990 [Microcystis aeruginosa Ma_QC_Ch_20071001_S25]|uniref:O-antigen ligase domain-containing protein n=1 Tax=Microcystis aeruginosa Ma_QC_Ch_20071001_S25D TaxID=2486250 RepID=A0A552FW98_MICAE|nr:MAG: hypothetical protein EWV57_08875 [Microcystis aeruginosa Ma_QC_Ch_20071001_S25D]TRU53655.1 MAG: hypothetical protein EWV49_02990 [Microcystis aeruginosa Ma_QC_Ch_20071001_S25]TRU64977.1 MAG: hypothetical protein EWV90_05665 [Microcystis aeruginosa Ma_QC_Ch_20071001_M135]